MLGGLNEITPNKRLAECLAPIHVLIKDQSPSVSFAGLDGSWVKCIRSFKNVQFHHEGVQVTLEYRFELRGPTHSLVCRERALQN